MLPLAIEVFAGVTAIDSSVLVTVRLVDPVIEPDSVCLAWMVVVPDDIPLTNPVALTVATLVLEELQVTVLVRSNVLPSVYVPVAVNCCVLPAPKEAFAGVTAIETRVGGVTVRPVVPLTVPKVPWIEVFPVFCAVAKPPLAIVATEVTDELQVTELVRFCVVPSL